MAQTPPIQDPNKNDLNLKPGLQVKYARDDEQQVVAVVAYHGLVKVLTEADLSSGMDAAVAAARVDLQKEEVRIEQIRKEEAAFEKGLFGAGVGLMEAAGADGLSKILGGMHDKMAVDGGASLPTVDQAVAALNPEKFDPNTPRPNSANPVQKMLGLAGLSI